MVRSNALDELTLTVVVDNETDTLSSVDEGLPQVPEMFSLLARIPPSRHHDGHAGVEAAAAASRSVTSNPASCSARWR